MGVASSLCVVCNSPLPDSAAVCPACGVATPGGRATPQLALDAQLKRLERALAGRYRIQRVLGQGGMATVYLADDLPHRRWVAIKVLRPELASAIGSNRFLREIGIASQLQHPHILPLYDSGDAEGLLYYVMPYVEGESLRERMARERVLPIGDVVRTLRDVADALTYAHRHGVVHRDIKPDNVLLSGRHALVADFGVAKAVGQETGPTASGAWVGTPGYMAPEQLAADPSTDHRADIFALGVMAYESLTGVRPTATDPVRPVLDIRPGVPAALDSLIMRCLEPKAADRWQRADELLSQLEARTTPAHPMTLLGAQRNSRLWRRLPAWAVIGAAGILGVATLTLMSRERGADAALTVPSYTQLTFEGNVGLAALSHDGEYLAYVTAVSGTQHRIMVQDLLGGTVLTVADSFQWVGDLRWSPDGTHLGVTGPYRGRLWTYLLPRLGGPAQPTPRYAPRIAWSPDGARLAMWYQTRPRGLEIVDLRSGRADSLQIPGEDHFVTGGDWSPNGQHFAVTTVNGDGPTSLWVLDLRTGGHTLRVADSVGFSFPRWAPDGRAVYFKRGGELYRIPVDPRTGNAEGLAERVLGIEGWSGWLAAFSVADDGEKLVYTRQSGTHRNFSIASVDTGGVVHQVLLTAGTVERDCPTLAPDGNSLAFLQASREGWDVYRVATRGGLPERLTFGGMASEVCPAWGPEGQIAFVTSTAGTRKVAIVAGTEGTPRVLESTRVSDDIEWYPASLIAYKVLGNRNFRLLDPTTAGARSLVQDESAGYVFHLHFSPNGRWAAFLWIREEAAVWVVDLEEGDARRLMPGQWEPIGWSSDGQRIYARDESGVVRQLALSGGQAVSVTPPAVDGATCDPSDTPDARVWVCSRSQTFSDAWAIDHFYTASTGRER